jgi:hypothetical protein
MTGSKLSGESGRIVRLKEFRVKSLANGGGTEYKRILCLPQIKDIFFLDTPSLVVVMS